MTGKKKFPPRRAYSLKEAAQLLDCSVEALLDWGNRGITTICLKVTEKTKFSKRYDDIGAYDTSDLYSKDSPVVINTKLFYSRGDWFEVGQAFIMMRPLTEDEAIRTGFKAPGVYGHLDKSVPIRWMCAIAGFWELAGGSLFSFRVGEEHIAEDAPLKPYGMTETEKENRGTCLAIARVAFTVDDLFLMSAEFERLRTYDPEENKSEDETAQIDEKALVSVNLYGIQAPIPRQASQEDRILTLLKKQGYDPEKLPKGQKGKPGVRAKIWNIAQNEKKIFVSKTTFDKAWQRLRGTGNIR